jgi:hypothetical protein
MTSEATSNGFIVDDTPPVITTPPTLSVDVGSMQPNTIVYRTLLRFNWAVSDNESFIERQHLSIKSHIGGEFNLSSMQVISICV